MFARGGRFRGRRCSASRRPCFGGWVGLLLGLLAACAPLPERVPAVPGPVVPERCARPQYPAGGRVFRLEPSASELLIYTYRGGRLARMGHNHVLSSRDFQGFVYLADRVEDSRLDLCVPLTTLVVDDAGERAAAGAAFASKPTATDIEGTRRNLLSAAVLDAARFPFLEASGTVTGGALPDLTLAVDLKLRGQIRRQVLPSQVSVSDTALMAAGELRLRQSDFGITPFSVLGGALTVEDELRVRYRLLARRVAGPPPAR